MATQLEFDPGTFRFNELLLAIAARLPRESRWAVACGSALALHGLPHRPADLDFFGPFPDVRLLEGSLTDLPTVFPLAWRTGQPFHSYFGRFLVREVEVDFVGDFSIETAAGRLVWDAQHPCWENLAQVTVAGQRIPLFSLEDLLVFYLALPEETAKLVLLRDALRARGIDRTCLDRILTHWPQMAAPVHAWLES